MLSSVLSFFLGDAALGIYTFISMIWDGLYQFLSVIRNNNNPKIARLFSQGEFEALAKVINQVKLYGFIGYAFAAALVLALYTPIIQWFALDPLLLSGLPILAILLGVTCLASWLIPFDQALSQCGAPATNSMTLVAGAITNLALNLILIPSLGMYGAAIATGTSWVVLGIYLILAIRHTLQIDILTARRITHPP